jgi:polyphosphate kinase
VVGRLLEHSRVYYFENGGDEEVFMGSADWMPRNLDRRVEVLSPITSEPIKRYLIDEYLDVYLRDNTKARLLNPSGRYERIERSRDEPLVNAQEELQRTFGPANL